MIEFRFVDAPDTIAGEFKDGGVVGVDTEFIL